MKKIAFFDFFGVIASEVAPVWFSRHFAECDAKRLKADIFQRADLGIISEDESYIEMERISGIPKEEIKREFYELIRIDGRMLSFIKEVKKRYPVYVLSNAAKPFLRNIIKKYGLSEYFDGIFISAEIKLAKPGEDYFKYVLKKIGATASDAVMTDDNKNNIKTAQGMGMGIIHYTDFDSFRTAFDKYFGTGDIVI